MVFIDFIMNIFRKKDGQYSKSKMAPNSTFFLQHTASLIDLSSDKFSDSILENSPFLKRSSKGRNYFGVNGRSINYAGSLGCNLDLCGSENQEKKFLISDKKITKIKNWNSKTRPKISPKPNRLFPQEFKPQQTNEKESITQNYGNEKQKLLKKERQIRQKRKDQNKSPPKYYPFIIDEEPQIQITNTDQNSKFSGAESRYANKDELKQTPYSTHLKNWDKVYLQSAVRDRSKVGIRHSLPFVVRSSTASGGSSGASDTQSQGSGGTDCKSDSLTPEGLRKGASTTSGMSVVSSSTGSNIFNRNGKKRDLTQTCGERESLALRQEVETLRAEITKARQTILHMQEREKKLKDRMGETALRGITDRNFTLVGNSPRIENLSLGDRRPSALVRRYAHIYDQTRLDALDALDALPDLRQADELKAKLLYSVVVLAFRSVSNSASYIREEIRNILQIAPPHPSSATHDNNYNENDQQSKSVELSLSSYFAHNIDNHDLSKNVDEVCEQIWATLYDYPCLKSSEALLHYAKACVRVAWGLVNQSPPYVLEYETRNFREDLHVRFHTSDPNQDTIKTYLWPALLEGNGGQCVHQGVVIT